jgi:signal transduction histidine kinase
MRINKSLNDPSTHFSNSEVKRSGGTTDFFFHAIENADGVPFQLIFGPRIGDGYYLNVGIGIIKLLGIPPEDFTEKMFHEMIEEVVPLSGDIPADPEETRRKFISGELRSYRAEVLVRRAGGEKRWIRDASLPLVDEETGKVIGAFGILYDISDNKNSQRIVRKAEERADELERLKKAFLSNITHEIRTPLNAIVGFSTLLGEPGYKAEQQQEFREIITRNTDHLLAIITDIVEVSKIEARMLKTRKEKVVINNIIKKIYDRFIFKASEKGLTLSFTAASDDAGSTILTDGYKLSQVLVNLVENAIKFTNEGRVEFGYEEKEGKIEFYVSDTGIGIAKENQPQVFSRFFQADYSSKRKYEGTGLGLTITKAYVELLGGVIWFTSHEGEGSEFRFTVEAGRSGE